VSDRGFGEMMQRGFALDDQVAFMQSALGVYGHRCAVTGRIFSPSDSAVHPDLTVFLFQPLEHGGTLSLGNALVVDIGAAGLLAKGVVLIDDHYRSFIAQPDLVDGGTEASGTADRPLILPEDPIHWPTRNALAYHRSMFRIQ
jgi:hypothetical protein